MEMQLGYLFPWKECPVSFQGVSAGVGDWNDGMHGGKEGQHLGKICVSHWRWGQWGREVAAGILLQSWG